MFAEAYGPAGQIEQPPMVLNLENILESSPCVLKLELHRMDAEELQEFEALLDRQDRQETRGITGRTDGTSLNESGRKPDEEPDRVPRASMN